MSWLGHADIGTIGITSHLSPAIQHGTMSRYSISIAGLKTGRAHQIPSAAEPAGLFFWNSLLTPIPSLPPWWEGRVASGCRPSVDKKGAFLEVEAGGLFLIFRVTNGSGCS